MMISGQPELKVKMLEEERRRRGGEGWGETANTRVVEQGKELDYLSIMSLSGGTC